MIPESPRWLLAHGRNAEALEIFAKIFKSNKQENKKHSGKNNPSSAANDKPPPTNESPSEGEETEGSRRESCLESLDERYNVHHAQPPEGHLLKFLGIVSDDVAAEGGQQQDPPVSARVYTLVDLFKGAMLRKRTLNVFFNWFVNGFVFYGLSLNLVNLGGNPFLNVLIGGAITEKNNCHKLFFFLFFSVASIGAMLHRKKRLLKALLRFT